LLIGKSFSPFTIPLFFRFSYSNDPLESGIVGALANILKGVSCRVEVDYDKRLNLDFVAGREQLHLPWVEEAIEMAIKREGIEGLRGVVDYHFEVNYGLDISSASATIISTLAALKKALSLKLSPLNLASISHIIELKYNVGFGCTFSQLIGGVDLFTTPSVPGKAKYLRIGVPDDLRIVVAGRPAHEFPIYTHRAFPQSFSIDLGSVKSFDDIIPLCRRFSEEFMSASVRLKWIASEISKANILSYGFGFSGKVVYALVYRDYMIDVASILLNIFPTEYIFISEIDPIGVRVYL
jgi:hypothetical protein